MKPRRLLLVGWEGASWKKLQPLLDTGELPALNRLIENGAAGSLLPVLPADPALQWTSIATGKRAWQHGVCHSPAMAGQRRASALWEILGRHGRRSLVVGWPATSGDQTELATIVSERYAEPTAPPGVKPWPPAVAGTYWPLEIGAALDKLRVSPDEIAADIISRYVPDWRKVDQKRDRRLGQLRVLLAADFSYQTAMAALMESRPWDFAAVRFSALAGINQLFPADAAHGHYRMLDLMLRRLVEVAGAETAVMVVPGLFAAAGPGFACDAMVHGAGMLDVAPTVLAWFGLPIGDDMEGRVLVESFSVPPKIERVPSWGQEKETLSLPPEADWNFAQSCLEAGRHEEALPVLTRVFQRFPELAENGHALFQCQLALGRLAEAEETLSVVLETVAKGVVPLLLRAELACAKRDFRQARQLVDQTRRQDSIRPEFMRRIGWLLLKLREWDALAALARQALQLDGQDSIAWLGLAEALLRKGDAAQAAEAAQRAIGSNYFLLDAHFVLGRALVAQGCWAEARSVMETLLQLQPGHRTAPAYLRRMRTSPVNEALGK